MEIDTADRATDDERMEEDIDGHQNGDDEAMIEDDGEGLEDEGEAKEGDALMEAEDAQQRGGKDQEESQGGLKVPELDMRASTPTPGVTEEEGEDQPDEEAGQVEDAGTGAATTDLIDTSVGDSKEDEPPALRTRSHDPQTPGPENTQAEESQKVNADDEVYDENDEVDYSIDIHNLPPVLIHLPNNGRRYLFALPPSGEAENLSSQPPQAGPSTELVWLEGRHEELGEASLSIVWAQLRMELEKEGVKGLETAEMVITERQMDLKMGEADIHLESVTLLDLLQVHHGCDLPVPVELYVTLEPHRFITRFDAIRQELEAQAERDRSEVYDEVGDGVADEEDAHEPEGNDEAPLEDDGALDSGEAADQGEDEAKSGEAGATELATEGRRDAEGGEVDQEDASQIANASNSEVTENSAVPVIVQPEHSVEEADGTVLKSTEGVVEAADGHEDAGEGSGSVSAETREAGEAEQDEGGEDDDEAEQYEDDGIDQIAERAVQDEGEEDPTAPVPEEEGGELAAENGDIAQVENGTEDEANDETVDYDVDGEHPEGEENHGEEDDEAMIGGDEGEEAEDNAISTLEADLVQPHEDDDPNGEEEFVEDGQYTEDNGEADEGPASPSKSLKRAANDVEDDEETEGKRQKLQEA